MRSRCGWGCFAGASAVFGLPKGAAFDADPLRFAFEVATLQRTFYLVDVMLLYAFLMLLVRPLFGRCAAASGGWSSVVLSLFGLRTSSGQAL